MLLLYLANLLNIICSNLDAALIFSRNVTSFECCDFNLEKNEDIDYRTRLILVVVLESR